MPVRLIGERLGGLGAIRGADLGSGAGRYDLLLLQRLPGLHLTCVDVTPAMLDRAARLLRSTCFGRFDLLHSSVEELSLPDDALDCVFTFNAVHHFDLLSFLRKCRAAVHDGGYVFIFTRLPEQNARTIWGRYFPEFCEHETRLYELGQMHDCIEAFGRLYLERVTCFRFPRVASLERLLQQARNRHYSTFALYEPAEFERALRGFEWAIRRDFPDPEHITWHDENILLEVRRFDC